MGELIEAIKEIGRKGEFKESFPKESDKKEDLNGIGGWLIIPTINLILYLINWGYTSIEYLILGMSETDGLFYFISSLLSGIYCYFLFNALLLEVKHKKDFPKRAISLLWINGICLFISSIILDNNSNSIYGAIGASVLASFGFAAVWTLYFNRSKRVKNTFIK